MSKEWLVDGDECPVEHTANVPPGFAIHQWKKDGGCCSICGKPGEKVIDDRNNPTKFLTVCSAHDR